MNLKMRKCLIINDRTLRFMGRLMHMAPCLIGRLTKFP
jgi:hypothetical protein